MKRPTFAQVTKQENVQQLIVKHQQTQNLEFTLIATPANNESISDVFQAISRTIKKIREDGGSIKINKIFNTRNAVVIKSPSRVELNALQEELGKSDELKAISKIYIPGKRDPTVVVKNVSKITDTTTFVKTICNMNPELRGMEDEIRMLFVMKSNTATQNIVLRLSPKAYQTIKKNNNTLYTDLERCHIQDKILEVRRLENDIKKVEKETDIDMVVDRLTDIILEAAYQSLEVKSSNFTFDTGIKWWNKELEQNKKYFHYVRNLYFHHKAISVNEYKSVRNKYKNSIRKAKRNSWRDFIEENGSNNPFGNAYRTLKKLSSSNQQKGLPIIEQAPVDSKESLIKDLIDELIPDDTTISDTAHHISIRNYTPNFTNSNSCNIHKKEIEEIIDKINVPNSELICYADDISIICWNKDLTSLKTVIEEAINTIELWCIKNKSKSIIKRCWSAIKRCWSAIILMRLSMVEFEDPAGCAIL
ncbi:hypothetical protein LAZ67_11002259 [Cordylochernes scorpioides]|uniref:Reverse transcriptase domain-containing protein n=1 Tax=Cordylochernes scorpioides TaxID=51811 RepID=A0ABY6KZU6_9ARAC|nr:hypothetical protein LAZ67_11002259 [Cordylochernes scorpioides]